MNPEQDIRERAERDRGNQFRPLDAIGGRAPGDAKDRAAAVEGANLRLMRTTGPIGVHLVELDRGSLDWKSRAQPMRGAIIR